MKVTILGAGINGVLSAYFLARSGCEVTVLEKADQAGEGCSQANGGQLSFSNIEPWSSTPISQIFKAALFPNSFLSVSDFKNKEFLKWSFDFFCNSNKKKSKEISKRIFKLGKLSREVLAEIMANEKIDFHYKQDGLLYFYSSEKKFNQAIIGAKYKKSLGINLKILTADECVKREPTLTKIYDEKILKGGILYPDDASGDCLAFLKGLELVCKNKLGVKFLYNHEVKNILTNHQKITGINTNQGVFTADIYLNCLGVFGNDLLKGIKINSGIYPIKGHSLSIPTDKLFLAPKLALHDGESKVVYTRFGNVLRTAGTACAHGFDATPSQQSINFMEKVMKNTLSDYGDLKHAKVWSGLRPFRADSTPLICQVQNYGNLFLNIGHGSLGWTLSFASARIISNLITGQKVSDDFQFLANAEKKIY